jgi:hypothetical protein
MNEILDSLAEDLTPLDLAKLTWRLGYPIPLDLAADLMAEGLDVAALEAEYLT